MPENDETTQPLPRRPERNTSGPGQASPARRQYGHRLPVVYTDDKGERTGALITRWHPVAPGEQGEPLCDLVIVGDDGGIARAPNVPHRSRLAAQPDGSAQGAEHWTWADE